ncbi:MAG: hypothetical protein FWG27_01605 [Treponema sp.]|jgi:hypothetical protein|nr:hypothetical protein [Treponema sp.]
MGFSDTLKELLDQGLAVSKELAAKAGEKAQDWSAKGLEASRDFASKAGAKIQKMGEKGVLMLEIKQLEGQAKKLIALLGAEAYSLFEQNTFSADNPEIKKILDQITAIKEILERKETELKNVGAN